MIYAIGIIISFVIYIIIGSVLSRKVSSVEDYYVSGRNATTVMITGTLIASFLSTVAFMGEVGFSYDGYPIVLLILSIFNASGYVFGVFLFGRYLRRSNSLTVPEYFGERFHSTKVRRAAALTTILGVAAYLVAVTQGGAVLLSEILDVTYPMALIIMWLVYSSFTFLSGARGVVFTDTIMFFIFTIGAFIAIPFIIKAAGGWPDAIINTATLSSKPDILSWHGLTGDGAYMGAPLEVLIWAVILGLVWGCVVAVSPWQTSRYLMAKNEHVAIRAGIISMVVLLVLYLFLQIGVSAVNVVNPDISPSEKVYIWSAMNLMPMWLGVIVLCGIMAAAISSCSTFLQLIGSSVARDLFGLKKAEQSSQNSLKTGRLSMIGVSTIILIVTLWQPPSVMWIGYFAATLFAASWGPVAFASIYSKSVTKEGAFWSIIAGFAGVIIGEILKVLGVTLPVYLHPVIIGVILSVIALVLGSKMSKITEEEKAYREHILKPPTHLNDQTEMAITRRYPLVLIVSGLLVIVITFVFYYWPLSTLAQ